MLRGVSTPSDGFKKNIPISCLLMIFRLQSHNLLKNFTTATTVYDFRDKPLQPILNEILNYYVEWGIDRVQFISMTRKINSLLLDFSNLYRQARKITEDWDENYFQTLRHDFDKVLDFSVGQARWEDPAERELYTRMIADPEGTKISFGGANKKAHANELRRNKEQLKKIQDKEKSTPVP